MVSMKDIKIVLASASPRRKELIALISSNVDIRPAECDEALPQGIAPREAAEYLSLIKNKATRSISADDELIISADTIVATENEILGKPVDKEDAYRMISTLSGKAHSVYTGVTISQGDKHLTFSEKTEVEFFKLTHEEIEAYVSDKEPYDKAGAYGIQGKAGLFIKGISGDYYNVVGLPIARLYNELKDFAAK